MRSCKFIFFLLMVLLLLSACSVPNNTDVLPSAEPVAAVPTEKPTPEPTAKPTPEPTPTPSPEERLLSTMTLEEKVAQLFFARCPDTGAEEMIAKLQPGALLLFGRDFNGLTREEVAAKIGAYQQNAKIPLLIGVDEEGGTVVRVSSNTQLSDIQFKSPRDLYAEGGTARLLDEEKRKCELLKSLGIQVNFAPVCDISDDPNGFMYLRSLGLPAENTADVIGRMVSLYETEKTGCVLKHFPGYGNADDTHKGMVYDDRPYEVFETEDFLPFKSGIAAGADCVMVTHTVVSCVDVEKPASLSEKWYSVLRNDLGFSGVMITDDLEMEAITEYTESSSAAVDAVLAGCDMLCSSDFAVQYEAVLEAVKAEEITESRINESVLRVLRWKLELGLME